MMSPTLELRELLDTVDAIWYFLDSKGFLPDSVDIIHSGVCINLHADKYHLYPAVSASNMLYGTHFTEDYTVEAESDYTLSITSERA